MTAVEVQLSDDLHAWLSAEARGAHRSLQAEVVYLLEQAHSRRLRVLRDKREVMPDPKPSSKGGKR